MATHERGGQRPPRAPISVRAAADLTGMIDSLRETNPELAEKLEQRQRDVASKVHRTPPESIRHLRFR